jgi:hypothetical protein
VQFFWARLLRKTGTENPKRRLLSYKLKSILASLSYRKLRKPLFKTAFSISSTYLETKGYATNTKELSM